MRSVFLDYATASFFDDLDPAALQRAMPGLELRDHTAQETCRRHRRRDDRAAQQAAHHARNHRAFARLKLIVLAATGTNNVDLEAAREHGIGVCNLRDYCTASVVQHTLGVLLLLTQKLREYDRLVAPAPGSAATSSACSTTRSASWRGARSGSSGTACSAAPWHARRSLPSA